MFHEERISRIEVINNHAKLNGSFKFSCGASSTPISNDCVIIVEFKLINAAAYGGDRDVFTF